jgi:hypothetical protein
MGDVTAAFIEKFLFFFWGGDSVLIRFLYSQSIVYASIKM